MSSRSSYVRRETLISVVINTVLSMAFVFLAFHGRDRIAVLGAHGIVVDMAPQTFMVTLMSCLVSGLVTRRRLRARALAWHSGTTELLAVHVVLTAVIAALLMTALVVFLSWAILPRLLPGGAGFLHLLLAKALFGALLAALATPWAINRVTRQ